jgi:hypothetical protein
LTGAAPISALAQAEVPADPPPAGSPDVVPEKLEEDRPIGAPDEEPTRTDELSRTGGVIRPPENVDPDMVEPPPDGGAGVIEVIPPPSPSEAPRQ